MTTSPHKPREEEALIARLVATRDDPLAFVARAYPWGVRGTPLEQHSGPRTWQVEEFEAIREHVRAQKERAAAGQPLQVYRKAIASGRGPGKSAFFGMLTHWHLSTHWGASAIVSANTETQLRRNTFAEMAKWVNMSINAHWFESEGMAVRPAPWFADVVRRHMRIDEALWQASGRTWIEERPDAFAAVHNAVGLLVVFDEASGIPAQIWDVADGFFTEENPYRFWLAASQMRRNEGRFYSLFHDPGWQARWKCRSLDIRGMEGIDLEWVREMVAQHGEESDLVRVEIRGLPPAAREDQFIAPALARTAQTNVVPWDRDAALVLGVDPAPRGTTAWRFRQDTNARDPCGTDTHGLLRGKDNFEIATHIIALDFKYRPDFICIDFGMGTGVIDVLKRHRLHGRLLEVSFGGRPTNKDGEFATRGSELWGAIRDWLPRGMIEPGEGLVDGSPHLFHQLTDRSWRWSGREDGKKILEPKEDMEARGVASPDRADALACTFAPALRARRRSEGLVAPRIVDGADAAYAGW